MGLSMGYSRSYLGVTEEVIRANYTFFYVRRYLRVTYGRVP
jgi:hypothetical protein